MAATSVVLQYLHLHCIVVATYHPLQPILSLKEGKPPAYGKAINGKYKRSLPVSKTVNRRNELLTGQVERAMATNNLNSIRQLTVQSLLSKEDENTFRRSFATIYPLYLPKFGEYRNSPATRNCWPCIICMNQSTDEIAFIMGINRSSVNVVRSRMRKNMKLAKEKSLDQLLKQYLIIKS